MEKLNMQTADAAEENVRRIARLFPGCVTETKNPDGTLCHAIDFDKIFKTNSPDTHRRVI